MSARGYDVGPVFLTTQLEQHVRSTLKAWMPWVLGEVDAAAEVTRPTRLPKMFVSDEGAKFAEEDAPPALIVVVPGSTGASNVNAARRGALSRYWTVNVSIIAGGGTVVGTRALAARYQAAVRLILPECVDDELVDAIDWSPDERNDLQDPQRKLVAVQVAVNLRVPRTMDTFRSFPPEPPAAGEKPTYPIPTGGVARITRQVTDLH